MSLYALRPIEIYSTLFIAASFLFLFGAGWIRRKEIPANVLLLLIAASALLRLALLPLDPIGSDDMYRYIWDGKVQDAGINPYSLAPDDPELAPLHSDRLPERVNHPTMKTVYFPLTQWVFYLCYQVSGEEVWAIKAVLVLAEGALVWILWVSAGALGISRTSLLLFALSPLAILQFSLDGHVDALGLPLFVGGLILYIRDRKVPGLLLLGLSLAVKPVALVVLPILFVAEKSAGARLRVLLLPLLPLVLQFLPYVFTSNPFESLFIYTRDWTFNGLVFESINAVVHENQISRAICALLLLISVGVLSFGKQPILQKCYYAVLLLLLFSPVVQPWYVIWLAALLPLVPRWSGIIFTAAVSLTVLTAVEYQMTGVWEQSAVVLWLEYAGVIGALGVEVWRGIKG